MVTGTSADDLQDDENALIREAGVAKTLLIQLNNHSVKTYFDVITTRVTGPTVHPDLIRQFKSRVEIEIIAAPFGLGDWVGLPMNLLSNSALNRDDDNDATPNGWTLVNNTGLGLTMQEGYDGWTQCAVTSASGINSNFLRQTVTGVSAGEVICASLEFKTTAPTGCKYSIWVDFQNDAGASQGTTNLLGSQGSNGYATGNAFWRRVVVANIAAPASTTKAVFNVEVYTAAAGNSGRIDVRKALFIKAAALPVCAKNYLVEGTCERVLDPYTGGLGSSTYNYWYDETALGGIDSVGQLYDIIPRIGVYTVTCSKASNGVAGIYTQARIAEAATYTLSLWVRAESGESITVQTGIHNGTNWVDGTAVAVGDTWTKVTQSRALSANTDCKFRIDFTASGTANAIYVDEAMVEKAASVGGFGGSWYESIGNMPLDTPLHGIPGDAPALGRQYIKMTHSVAADDILWFMTSAAVAATLTLQAEDATKSYGATESGVAVGAYGGRWKWAATELPATEQYLGYWSLDRLRYPGRYRVYALIYGATTFQVSFGVLVGAGAIGPSVFPMTAMPSAGVWTLLACNEVTLSDQAGLRLYMRGKDSAQALAYLDWVMVVPVGSGDISGRFQPDSSLTGQNKYLAVKDDPWLANSASSKTDLFLIRNNYTGTPAFSLPPQIGRLGIYGSDPSAINTLADMAPPVQLELEYRPRFLTLRDS